MVVESLYRIPAVLYSMIKTTKNPLALKSINLRLFIKNEIAGIFINPLNLYLLNRIITLSEDKGSSIWSDNCFLYQIDD